MMLLSVLSMFPFCQKGCQSSCKFDLSSETHNTGKSDASSLVHDESVIWKSEPLRRDFKVSRRFAKKVSGTNPSGTIIRACAVFLLQMTTSPSDPPAGYSNSIVTFASPSSGSSTGRYTNRRKSVPLTSGSVERSTAVSVTELRRTLKGDGAAVGVRIPVVLR